MDRFVIKPEIYYGTGAIEYLTTLNNEKALIITDIVTVQSGLSEQLTNILKSSVYDYDVFSDIRPEPAIDIIAQAISRMNNIKPDLVIALGGSATIDAAKSNLWAAEKIVRYLGLQQYQKPQFIAIPTASGTGSETTPFSFITIGDKRIPLFYDDMLPDIAIIDPIFVKAAPQQIIADMAIIALTHSIEAYVSKDCNDYTDALVEKAVKIIFDYLLTAYKDEKNFLARQKLHNASCMAGMAATNALLGLNHSMVHALNEAFQIPYVRATAILLPTVIRYNANLESGQVTTAAIRYAELAKLIGLPSSTVFEGVNHFIAAVKVLLQETNYPSCLKEIGIPKDGFLDKLPYISMTAINDSCIAMNPRATRAEEVLALYATVYGK
jgi:alcohol dehydrogenase class IV